MPNKSHFFQVKNEKKNIACIGGVAAGVLLYKVPVIGVALGAFSLIMLFSTIRSDERRAAKLSKNGMSHYEQGHYSYAYIMFKKAYELSDENPETIKMLILSNIHLSKDPVEARILIDELDVKWKSRYSQSEIDELRDMLSLRSVS